MNGIITDIVTPTATAIVGAVAGSYATYLFTRRQQKAERTPHLLFEFADLSEHENLGAVGFRNIASKLELLISGTIRNAGTALATGIRLDIYHFQNSAAPPVHEIAGIQVADALRAGEAATWNKSIRLADITVEGPEYQPGTGPIYKSGPTGVFSGDTSSKYYHHHVVFSCKNLLGEEFSTVYCTEKVIENKTFKGNKMVLFGQFGKYNPMVHFPKEWREEIAAKESAFKNFMATQGSPSAPAIPDL
ncbi:hypothetical protein [Acidocella facilis]|uniref:hypothetical protein n=1 Tax=Acidocella facilis TaxID=525 RepID=UPI001F31746A|nr:hypothetical protein [Acidocella facilis]